MFRSAILAIILLASSSNAQICNVRGECVGGRLSSETRSDIERYEDCRDYCRDDDPLCDTFTYLEEDGICVTYIGGCEEIDPNTPDCFDRLCATGEPSCPDLTCARIGQCTGGVVIAVEDRDKASSCLFDCSENTNCAWYEHDPEEQVCFLLEDCPVKEVRDCPFCTIGEFDCDVSDNNDDVYDYEYVGNIFITGGTPSEASPEVVNMDPNNVQTPCSVVAQMNADRTSAVSTFGNGNVIVCGGIGTSTCETYDNVTNEWIPRGNLDNVREAASGVMLSDNQWWITGGGDANSSPKQDTIIYDTSTDQFQSYVDLPQPLMNHHMVRINDTSFVLVSSQGVWLFDLNTEVFTLIEPPRDFFDDMYVGRAVKSSGTVDVVVTDASSTELFNMDSLKWRSGPIIPSSFPDFRANGGSADYGNTMIIANFVNDDYGIDMYDPDDEEWVEIGTVLQGARERFQAVTVPADYVECF